MSSVVEQVSKRLEDNKSDEGMQAIEELAAEHDLGDDAQLALRLLSPTELQELCAGGDDLREKLNAAEDKGDMIRQLVGMLDPEVGRLVDELKRMEETGEEEAAAEVAAEEPAVETAATNGDIMAEVELRLEKNKTAVGATAIEQFKQDHDLNDEVHLGLKLLTPPHLDELLAGEEDIKQKIATVPDRNQLIMSLISMLDPEVERLVKGLSALEGEDEAMPEKEQKPAEATEAASNSAELLAEAERRLTAHKKPTTTAAIKKLTTDHNLSDEAQLGLRLLTPPHLEELLAGGEDLHEKLNEVPDKGKLILDLISMLDPEVEKLIQGLQQMEEGGNETQKKDSALLRPTSKAGGLKRPGGPADGDPAKRLKGEEKGDKGKGKMKGKMMEKGKGKDGKGKDGKGKDGKGKEGKGKEGKGKEGKPAAAQGGPPPGEASAGKGKDGSDGKGSKGASKGKGPEAEQAAAPKEDAGDAPKRRKGPKCMFCKGPHRAADCPKNK